MFLINWFDWITPTTPFASLFFGIIFTLIIAFSIWYETREKRTFFIATITGLCVTFIGVELLYLAGYYG